MENSKNSFSFIPLNLSCNNVRINEERDDSFDQESGWTSYVEDFSSSVSSESSYYSSSFSYSKSCNNGGVVKFCMEMNRSFRFNRLHMKRSRKMGEDDDELEDTATSAHSPIAHEVQYLNQMEMDLRLDNNPKQKKRREIISQVKEGNCSISGLKDIGLCLVPLSMAVNYFG